MGSAWRWQKPARRNRADAADLGPLSDFEKRSGTCGVSVGPESRAPRCHPAILAAVTTAAAMAVAPQVPEQMRLLLIVLPAVFCLLAALHLSSGIALYWITSNAFGTAQTLALRRVLKRRS